MVLIVEIKAAPVTGNASTTGYQASEVETRLYRTVWSRVRGTYQQEARYWDYKVARIMEQIAELRRA